MGFLTTKKCCGVLSLKSGGLILGWAPLMMCIPEFVMALKSNDLHFAGMFAVLALLLGFWIQGITHKRSAWMFPMVIFWNVALWTEVIWYTFAFYYHVIAPSKHHIIQTTHREMLIRPLATVITWHFAAVSYSLYKRIDDDKGGLTMIHLQRTTTGAAASAARPQSTNDQPTTTAPPSPPPSPPPSYDVIFKV